MTLQHASILLEGLSFFMVTIDLYGRERIDKLHDRIDGWLAESTKVGIKQRLLAVLNRLRIWELQIMILCILLLLLAGKSFHVFPEDPGFRRTLDAALLGLAFISLLTVVRGRLRGRPRLLLVSIWSLMFSVLLYRFSTRYSISDIPFMIFYAIAVALLPFFVGAAAPMWALIFSIFDDFLAWIVRKQRVEGVFLISGSAIFVISKCLQW